MISFQARSFQEARPIQWLKLILLVLILSATGCARDRMRLEQKEDEAFKRARIACQGQWFGQALQAMHEVQDTRYQLSGIRGSERGDVQFRLSLIYEGQGLYARAIDARRRYMEWDVLRPHSDPVPALHHLADLCVKYGDFDAAWKHLQTALPMGKEISKRELHENFVTMNYLPHEAFWHLAQGDYKKAIEQYRQALYVLERSPAIQQDINMAHNDLGCALFFAGEFDEAARHFAGSLGSNETSLVSYGAVGSKAALYLGRICEMRGEPEKAREYYERGYGAMEKEGRSSGYGRTQRADALMELGFFNLRQSLRTSNGESQPTSLRTPAVISPEEERANHLEEAVVALEKASRLRYVTGSETHPDHADVLRGLAMVSVARNDLTSASAYTDRALHFLDDSVVPLHARVASHLVARNSIAVLSGNATTSATTDTRLNAILQKPLGPFRLDFLDTCEFYEQAMIQAGRHKDAAELRKLILQQMNRP